MKIALKAVAPLSLLLALFLAGCQAPSGGGSSPRTNNLEALKTAANGGDADAALKWGAPKAVSRREPLSLSPSAVSRVMGANAEKLPAYAGAEKGGAGYAIYKVNRVAAVEARSEADRKALQGQYDQVAGSLQLDAYLAALRARAKVEVNQANLERK